jgi:alkanesulfonate monooxygenase SsuD/methylene tetrahydromethanopterin reductase-like flavin-dependent oxidoreductase (luciferase family)
MTPETAEWAGSWADGLITISRAPDQLKEVIAAFHRGGGEHKPMYLKVQLSFAADERRAAAGAHDQWAGNVYPSGVLSDLRSPAQFDGLAAATSGSELAKHVRISSDVQQHADWLAADLALGFERLYLHNVNREQEAFIDAFGTHVLPAFDRSVT